MDWAENKANQLLPDLGDFSQNSLREDVAQALRDVRRETAEECCKIIKETVESQYNCPTPVLRIQDAIRERFDLKEKS